MSELRVVYAQARAFVWVRAWVRAHTRTRARTHERVRARVRACMTQADAGRAVPLRAAMAASGAPGSLLGRSTGLKESQDGIGRPVQT